MQDACKVCDKPLSAHFYPGYDCLYRPTEAELAAAFEETLKRWAKQ